MFTRLGLVLPLTWLLAFSAWRTRRAAKKAQVHSDWCEKEVGPAPTSKEVSKLATSIGPNANFDALFFAAMHDHTRRSERAREAKASAITATNKSFRADSRLDFVRTLGNRTFWAIWPAVEGGCIVGLLMWMSVNAPDTLASWFNVAHQALTVGGTMFSSIGNMSQGGKDAAMTLGGLMGVAGLCWGAVKVAKRLGSGTVAYSSGAGYHAPNAKPSITHDANQERLLGMVSNAKVDGAQMQKAMADLNEFVANQRRLRQYGYPSNGPFTTTNKIG